MSELTPDPVAVLGDFRLLREIGRGGMGIVYEAYQTSLRRKVALKVLTAAGAMDSRQIQRFQIEVQAAAALHHPNIVAVYSVGCDRGIHHYAMELIEGRSLADLIAEMRESDGLDPIESSEAHRPSEEPRRDGILQRLTPATPSTDDDGGNGSPSDPLPHKRGGWMGRSVLSFSWSHRSGSPSPSPAPSPLGEKMSEGRRSAEAGQMRGDCLRAQAPPPHPPHPVSAEGGSPRRGEEREGARGSVSRSSSRSRAHCRAVAVLGIQAAQALEHAHQHGILHRDIKPSNLLIDHQGKIWVADFGLARIQGDSQLTQTGDLIGTLRYMSPESAVGGGKRGLIDERTDVYSLGATLYECLTLRPAFAGDDRAELLGRITREEPTAPRWVNLAIPKDLETIILKAMAKEPVARYATAQDLADDLGRYLSGEPIKARPPSVAARVRSSVRRHRTFAASAAILGLAAVVIVAVGAPSLLRQRRLSAQLSQQNQRQVRQQEARQLAEQKLEQLEMVTRIRRHKSLVTAVKQTIALLQSDQTDLARANLRGLEATRERGSSSFMLRCLRQVLECNVMSYTGHEAQVHRLAMSADGRTLASSDDLGVIRLWDLATGQQLRVLQLRTRTAHEIVFGPGGHLLAAAGNSSPKHQSEVAVWDAELGRHRAWIDFGNRLIGRLGFSADGRVLAVWSLAAPSGEGDIRFYDIENTSVKPKLVRQVPFASWPAYARGGRAIAVRAPNGTLSVMDVASGATKWADETPTPMLYQMQFSADGRRFAYHVHEWGALVRDTVTGREVARLHEHAEKPVHFLEFSPDGSTLAAIAQGSDSAQRWLHDLKVPAAAPRILRAENVSGRLHLCSKVTFSPDGSKFLYPVTRDGVQIPPLGLWDVASGGLLAVYRGRWEEIGDVMFTPDGNSVVLRSQTAVKRWLLDTRDSSWPVSLGGHTDEAWALAFSPDGRWLASGSDDTDDKETIKIWDVATEKKLRGWLAGEGTVSKLAFSPDGKVLASSHLADKDNIRLWDPATKERVATLAGHTRRARAVAFSPDGGLLASCDDDAPDTGPGTVRLWDLRDRSCSRILPGLKRGIGDVTFSPDGTIIAAADDGATRFWRLTTGEELAPLSGESFLRVAWCPGAGVVATAAYGGTVELWDLSNKTKRLVLSAASGLSGLAFTPDGAILAAAGDAGVIHCFDTLTGQELLTLEGHKARINGLAFSPDGSILASCSHDGAVKLWHAGP